MTPLVQLLMVGAAGLLAVTARGEDAATIISLWTNGAPGFESRRSEPELAQDYWVRNIHNPSLTVFLPPADKATGAAVVICPGGGHRELVFKAEGEEPARYLNELGIAAFVLKYRLAREQGSPYSLPQHAREDGRRAMRLVRGRAAEWGIDPKRIGMMGFSAGGEVVSMVVYGSGDGDPNAPDPLDRVSCRPDFTVMIYPGPLGIPEMISSNVPPAFLLVANDDRGASGNIVRLIDEYRQAHVPMEAHIYAKGGHGFNMGNRSKLASVKDWPQRLADWLGDSGFLKPAPGSREPAK